MPEENEEEYEGEEGDGEENGDEESHYSDEDCDAVEEDLGVAEGELKAAKDALKAAKKEVMDKINQQLKDQTGYDYNDYDTATDRELQAGSEYRAADEALGAETDEEFDAMESAYDTYDQNYDDFWEHSGEVGRLDEQNSGIERATQNDDGTAVEPADFDPNTSPEVEIGDEAQGDTEYERWLDQERLNDEAIDRETAEGIQARDAAAEAEGELNELVGSEDGVEKFEDYRDADEEKRDAEKSTKEIRDAINEAPGIDGEDAPSAQKNQLDLGSHPDIQDEKNAVSEWEKTKGELENELNIHCTPSEEEEDDGEEDGEDPDDEENEYS